MTVYKLKVTFSIVFIFKNYSPYSTLSKITQFWLVENSTINPKVYSVGVPIKFLWKRRVSGKFERQQKRWPTVASQFEWFYFSPNKELFTNFVMFNHAWRHEEDRWNHFQCHTKPNLRVATILAWFWWLCYHVNWKITSFSAKQLPRTWKVKERSLMLNEKQLISSRVDVYACGEGTVMEIVRWQNHTWNDLVGKKGSFLVFLTGRHVDFFWWKDFFTWIIWAFEPVESEAEKDVVLGSGIFCFPCMKDVSADDMCWNCCKMRRFAVTFDDCFDLSCFHINVR